MQQFRAFRFWFLALILLLVGILGLTACGGGSGSSNNGGGTNTNTLVLSPTNLSFTYGDVLPVTAHLQDSSGNTISAGTITWTLDSTNLVTVSPTGGKCGDTTNSTTTTCVCAGKWRDTNYIDCDVPGQNGVPGTPTPGMAKLTASNGTNSASINIFLHAKIARVVVGISKPVSCTNPPTSVPDCTSSTGTFQIYAQACDSSNNPVVVDPGDGTGFTYPTSDATVVASDGKGLLTAANPGVANVFANTSNVVSGPLGFKTCAVKSISAHVSGATDTTITADAGTNKALGVDVVDTKGKTITVTNSRLTFASSILGVATTDGSGTVTAASPGTTSVVAACTPPTCNNGFTSVFSNPVVVNVNGTTSTDIVVASPTSTQLYPITSSTATVGTAVTLPYKPNSLVYARTGLGAYLGSDTTLMAYDARGTAAPLTLSSNGQNIPGLVVGVSNDAGLIAVYDATSNSVSIINYTGTSTTLIDKIIVSGIPANCQTTHQCPKASFTPDNKSAYIVAGNTLYISSPNANLKSVPLSATAKDITVTKQGSFAFVSQNDSSVVPYATCNNARINSGIVDPATTPQFLESSEDGTKLFLLTPPTLGIATTTTDHSGCPPSLTDPLTNVDLGQGAFTATQMLVSTNGNRVVALTNSPNVILYDSANATTPVKVIPLAGGATVTTGGIMLDGATAYVGGSDGKVHKIDLVAGTDAAQITVSIPADFVATRFKQN